MPKRKKTRTPRRRTFENTHKDENQGFGLIGFAALLAIIAAGLAYSYGYFPETFNLANFELPNMSMPEVPHSTETPKTN